MMWFKHFTGYRKDPKVMALREEFGIAGTAVPILMVEMVAESLGPTNPKPFLTYSVRVWSEFLGITSKKLKPILARMQEIDLFEVTIEDNGKITFGSDKILQYCDKYTEDLKRSGKIPAKKYGKKSGQTSGNENEQSSSGRSRTEEKRREDLTTTHLGTDGPDASMRQGNGKSESETEVPEEERKANLETLRKAIDQMPGAHPQQQAPKAHDSGNGKIPRAEGQEVEDMGVKLELEGFVDPAAQDILDAWWARKQGTHNEYALAAMLDKHNIKGQDRSKVYRCLGVV